MKQITWIGVLITPLVGASIWLWNDTTKRDGAHPLEMTRFSCVVPYRAFEPDETSAARRERDALVLAVAAIERALGESGIALVSVVRAVAEAQAIISAVPALRSLEDALEPSLHGVEDASTAWRKAHAAIRILNDRLEDCGDEEG